MTPEMLAALDCIRLLDRTIEEKQILLKEKNALLSYWGKFYFVFYKKKKKKLGSKLMTTQNLLHLRSLSVLD